MSRGRARKVPTGLRNHALSLVTLGLFALCLVGQSVAGFLTYNGELRDRGAKALTYAEYLSDGHFVEATFENWESEFFQMGMYVLLVAWLKQKGSAESKSLDEREPQDESPEAHRTDPNAPWPVRRGGWVLAAYSHSLSAALFLLFFVSFYLHAAGGVRVFNAEEAFHGRPPVTTFAFMRTSQFWFESLQNWQSEFVSVFTLVVLSIFLREKGSPQSKPVAAPNDKTGA